MVVEGFSSVVKSVLTLAEAIFFVLENWPICGDTARVGVGGGVYKGRGKCRGLKSGAKQIFPPK